ncbi:MAG: hypothetical protein HGN29_10690 [Asgard group archaeon]|nr:hypothetical protein [Asgard group archaeon]
MNIDNRQQFFYLDAGKTIDSLEGEIVSVHFSQWGTYGKVKVENEIYNYKLKNSEFAKSIIVGLDLIIKNGFCIRNKKGEIVVTEGKFGSANTAFKVDRYYCKKQNEEQTITGLVKSTYEKLDETGLRIELFLPPNKEIQCTITAQKTKETKKTLKVHQITKGSIIKIKGKETDTDFYVKSIEILPENHFWYIFLSARENQQEHVSILFQIMNNQMEIVDSFYESFKDILFNIGKDVSKTSLVALRDLLHSKIFNGELIFPYNILIPEHRIRKYFNQMIDFCREYIYENKNLNGPEGILLLIRNFYPEYKL